MLQRYSNVAASFYAVWVKIISLNHQNNFVGSLKMSYKEILIF